MMLDFRNGHSNCANCVSFPLMCTESSAVYKILHNFHKIRVFGSLATFEGLACFFFSSLVNNCRLLLAVLLGGVTSESTDVSLQLQSLVWLMKIHLTLEKWLCAHYCKCCLPLKDLVCAHYCKCCLLLEDLVFQRFPSVGWE